jgi:Ca-activated chloride channel family protein
MDIRFDDPWILLLLLALPALALVAFRFRGERSAFALGTLAPTAKSRRTWRMRLQPLLPLLRLAAVALLIIGLARPQRGEAVTGAGGEGIDIVLAYDASSSMTQPFARGESRLEAAERVLKRFVEGRENDRVGLVVFRGNSLTLSPLTTDYAAVSDAVSLAPTLRLDDGTAIGVAMGESINLLRTSQSASRIVILLTDGENNSPSIEPLAAARIAESLGIRIYTIGVVSRGANRSQSSLNVDEAALREIASITGAGYNRAEDPGALQDIYDNIDALEKSRFEGEDLTRYAEIASPFLALAAILLAVELALRCTAFRRAS